AAAGSGRLSSQSAATSAGRSLRRSIHSTWRRGRRTQREGGPVNAEAMTAWRRGRSPLREQAHHGGRLCLSVRRRRTICMGETSETVMSAERRKSLAVMLVPMFMSLLSVSIVNVILPDMQRSIEASNSAIQWVLSGYTLAFGVFLVAAGRAGDLFGRGRLFVIGVGVFALGSLIAGLSPDPLVLNIARIVMGIGSGLLSPQGVGMLQQY